MSKAVVMGPLDGTFMDGATEAPSVMSLVRFADVRCGSDFMYEDEQYCKYGLDIGILLSNERIQVKFEADEFVSVEQGWR